MSSKQQDECISSCSIISLSSILFPSEAEEVNAENLQKKICAAPIDEDFEANVLPNLELLLDKFSLECQLFLPKKSSESKSSNGKKCNIKSKMGDTAVEFVIRSGVLKRMRFN